MPSYRDTAIEIHVGDITVLDVDAIVNAANPSLLGGGGVDGAIHRAAGPGLVEACRALGGARPGEVKMTPGFDLPARHVLHAVGPVWRGGTEGEAEVLASCYVSALDLLSGASLESIAFPCISTGVYGYPPERAAAVALSAVTGWLADGGRASLVVFCCFSDADRALYERLWRESD